MDRKIPSGLRARTVEAGVWAGTTVQANGKLTIKAGDTLTVEGRLAGTPGWLYSGLAQTLDVTHLKVLAGQADAKIWSGSTQTITASQSILVRGGSGGSGGARPL